MNDLAETTSDSALSEETLSIGDRVYLERVRQYFGNAKGNVIGATVGLFVIVLALYRAGVPEINLQMLGAVFVVLSAILIAVEYFFARSTLSVRNAKIWTRIRLISANSLCLCLGLAVFLFPENVELNHEMMVLIVLLTVSGVSFIGYSIMPSHFVSLNLVTVLPFTLYLFTRSGDEYYILIFMSVAWQFYMLSKTWKISGITINAIFLNESLRDELAGHEKTRHQLEFLATHDDLTELPNRRLLIDRITTAIARAKRNPGRFAVMYVDLDGFKAVNDDQGHQAGDIVLQEVARRLTHETRETDVVARVGGDEFVIVYADIKEGLEEVEMLATRILQSIARPVALEKEAEARISSSIGIAIYPDNGGDAETLIKRADQSMYNVKNADKNSFAVSG
jgi:diguanylate cyclase (GGDEF)-like protein